MLLRPCILLILLIFPNLAAAIQDYEQKIAIIGAGASGLTAPTLIQFVPSAKASPFLDAFGNLTLHVIFPLLPIPASSSSSSMKRF